jgi:hypothetical protein
MITDYSSISQNKVPELSLSLWSIRHRMFKYPAATINLIKNWGINKVEVAGCFKLEANELFKSLNDNQLSICSIVAPPIKFDRDFDLYYAWINKYPLIFKTNTVILQTLPENFRITKNATNEINFSRIYDILIKIATTFPQYNFGYHCFPHDFSSEDNQTFISFLFSNPDIPKNFGLQLDTFWLNVIKTNPNLYKDYPVIAVHLNERNDKGQNQLLGSDPNKCIHYIYPLLNRYQSINWILENDSDENLCKDDGEMTNVVSECIHSWPNFWLKLNQFAPQNKKDEFSSLTTNTFNKGPVILEKYSYENEIYQTELDSAFTEHLFGNNPDLEKIDSKDIRLNCYVDKRLSKNGEFYPEKYYAERIFFNYFWPNSDTGQQLIQIVGGAGSGKTTFIRFFFEYFLPNYESLINDTPITSEISRSHMETLNRHILLYVNLRKHSSLKEFGDNFWNSIGERLAFYSKKLNFTIEPKVGGKYSEEWVREQIMRLSREVENNERKWFISWILDNSDQMDNESQIDFYEYIFDWINDEPLTSFPNQPVLDGQHRELWRIVIPIRPETLTGFEIKWQPFKNRKLFELDPIDHDLLISKRSEYLYKKITTSTKNCFVDVVYGEQNDQNHQNHNNIRPQFDMVVPSETASIMQKGLQVAHGGKSYEKDNIPEDAKPIFDNLVNDSARRRLFLVKKITSSRIFLERLRENKLSKFYYLESLILGNNNVFKMDDPDNLLLNLYNMGDNSKDDPYSKFVGLHSIYLLKLNMNWDHARIRLEEIGYTKNNLQKCEELLIRKDVLKYNLKHYSVEYPIVNGYWDLLKERSYTDEMAVACADLWKTFSSAQPTNPLTPKTLITRVSGSIWFLEEIWKAESLLCQYPTNLESQRQVGEFSLFSKNRISLNLPSFTKIIANEYSSAIIKLNKYPNFSAEIEKKKNEWERISNNLQLILTESSKDGSLDPRQY